MSACIVNYKVFSNGSSQSFSGEGEIKYRDDMIRISFEDGAKKTFSLLKDKVVISSIGEINYSFSLKKGESYKFILQTPMGEIPAEVRCSKLAMKTDAGVHISGKYSSDIGGNHAETDFKLEVKEP